MHIRFTRKALDNLDSIASYLTKHSPQGSQARARRHACWTSLTDKVPGIGTRADVGDVRRMVVRKYPHVI